MTIPIISAAMAINDRPGDKSVKSTGSSGWSAFPKKFAGKIPWFSFSGFKHELASFVFLVMGTLTASVGYSMFQVPHHIAAGGIGGVSIIINNFTGWPVGIMYMVMNIPLLLLGFFYLGRWAFVIRTALAVLIFSTTIDYFTAYLPPLMGKYPLTKDVLLSAIYGGMVGGIGGGLVYRAGATMGGTAIIGRIIQQKTGTPLSQIYVFTDGAIVLAAGVIFGWELALYAMLTLFLSGIAADYTLEGPSNVRTATIITNRPDELGTALMDGLGRGLSEWNIRGTFTGKSHTMFTCTIYRPQVNQLKRIIARIDPEAFVTIGVAHQALGSGFMRLK
jgi:uncharacterized membrane-anchored protein YitT (DUF2179 family)